MYNLQFPRYFRQQEASHQEQSGKQFDCIYSRICQWYVTENQVATPHQHPEAVSSQQSMTCGRPRAQETSGNSPVTYKTAPEPKLTSIGLSQRVWKLIPAETFTQRDCEFVHISRHFTKILRHTGCHESDGAVRWNHVLTRMPSAEQTLYWKKESGLMHFVVLLTKSEWSIVRIKTGRLFKFAQYKHTVMVPESIQLCRYH